MQKVQQEGPKRKNATLRNIADPKTEKGQHHDLPWEKLPQMHMPHVLIGAVVQQGHAFEKCIWNEFENQKEKEKVSLDGDKKEGGLLLAQGAEAHWN